MDAHADAVARAKAIAARLAGTSAGPAITGASSYGARPSAPGGSVDAMLEAALRGSSGGASAPAPLAASLPAAASGTKRGVEDALASLIPGLGHVETKRARPDGGGATTKKVWIPSDRNPGYNYVGLLIGPGGSKQRELVANAGGDVKISIRGKGSSSKGDVVPGMPEEPLHVLLEGSQACVEKADAAVRELLFDSEAADKEKARQLGSMGGGGGAG